MSLRLVDIFPSFTFIVPEFTLQCQLKLVDVYKSRMEFERFQERIRTREPPYVATSNYDALTANLA